VTASSTSVTASSWTRPVRIVADAGGKEQAILAEVDPTLVARTRAEFPFLADRRA